MAANALEVTDEFSLLIFVLSVFLKIILGDINPVVACRYIVVNIIKVILHITAMLQTIRPLCK